MKLTPDLPFFFSLASWNSAVSKGEFMQNRKLSYHLFNFILLLTCMTFFSYVEQKTRYSEELFFGHTLKISGVKNNSGCH